MLKILIVICLLLLLLSLFSSLFFLFRDQASKKRTYYLLAWRLFFSVALIALVAYGLYSGELGNRVIWLS